MTLRPSLLPLRLLLLLSGAVCRTEAGFETESPVRTLQVETLVEPPEPCAEPAAFGDTLHVHYTFRPGAEKRRVGRAPRSASPLGLPVAFCPEGTAGLQLRGGCRRRPGAQPKPFFASSSPEIHWKCPPGLYRSPPEVQIWLLTLLLPHAPLATRDLSSGELS
ncbi:peptidyl-prolyl cis-trans isomerase FKBP11 isoform X2 [Mirounga angustirostris]|uniref:peptidyl-prolyl cis-trans isomerase FKBP11 isoform X2 n=1 Tax=Mirounga angustirostris TaxID=9716 RepID=UPI00313D58BB